MSISIEQSERFQKEYSEFSHEIEQISDLKLKTELDLELKKLIKEVRKVDDNHKNILTKNTLPDMVDESRYFILEIRRKISKSLKDYKSSSTK